MTNSKSYIPNSPLNSFIKDDLRFPPDHVRLTRIHAFSRLYSTVTLLARLRYNRNHQYIPDFVVETENVIYLVEVKGEDKMKDADVLAKKNVGYSIAGRPPCGEKQTDTRNGNTCLFRLNRLRLNRRLKFCASASRK